MDVFCGNVAGSENFSQATSHFDDIFSRFLQLRTNLFHPVMLFGGDFFRTRFQIFNLLQRIVDLIIRMELRRERFPMLRVQVSLGFDQFPVLR